MTAPLTSGRDIADGSGLLLGWPTAYDERAESVRATRPKIKTLGSRQNLRNAIGYKGDGHLVTFAPTGAGKGAGVIIPNLLHYSGSMIVVDPKGENFVVTARYRQSIGQKVVLLDPFSTVPDTILQRHGVERGKLNPLDICSLTGTATENDAQMIAESLSTGGFASDPFWDLQAMKVLAGIISIEMEDAIGGHRAPSFENIVALVYATDPFETVREKIKSRPYPPFIVRSVGAGGFLDLAQGTRDGILATVQSYLAILISTELLPYIDKSTISISEIQTNSAYTLYIVIPPTKLDSHSASLRSGSPRCSTRSWSGSPPRTCRPCSCLTSARTWASSSCCARPSRCFAVTGCKYGCSSRISPRWTCSTPATPGR